MITDLILTSVLGVITGLFSILPTWGVDTSVMDNALHLTTSAGSVDGWLPETMVFGCLAMSVGVRLFFWVWNGLQWLYHLVPFNGGG